MSRSGGSSSVRVAALLIAGSIILCVTFPLDAAVLPEFFSQEDIFTGLSRPTAVRFAGNGTVFVAQKGGQVLAYESLNDTTPTLVVDLHLKVHDFWDRGLLGLAVDPDFPVRPYLYVLYAFDAYSDGSYPRWGPGVTPSAEDPCPFPPGSLGDGCVVYGMLSRIHVDPATLQAVELPTNGIVGPDEPLLFDNWCQQYPSHSIGDLLFGSDGYLYVSAGEGAAFHFYDWGQDGTPQNPCDDPPDGHQTAAMLNPNDDLTAEGGALRSQDILTPSDRTDLDVPGRPGYVDYASFGGALLRVDVSKLPVRAPSDNPLVGLNSVADDDLIIAVGLRNPYRIANRPGTAEIWLTDVGWFTWEEINRVVDPLGNVENFGWPCYEGDDSGSNVVDVYDDLAICQAVYDDTMPEGIESEAPFFAYHHEQQVVTGEICGTGSSAATGVAFNHDILYPSLFDDALFFADAPRNCIWTMFADESDLPDPATREPLVSAAGGQVVDLQIGPDGLLYYVDFDSGAIRRVVYENQTPSIEILQPTDGAEYLENDPIDLQASASDLEDGDASTGVQWRSDLDGMLGEGATLGVVLSVGDHLITASISDRNGASVEESVSIGVVSLPAQIFADGFESGDSSAWSSEAP